MEPPASTDNEQSTTLFRPNKVRSFAPIPSLSRHHRNRSRLHKTTQAFDNCGNRFSPSYAKHARSMEIYKSPPRTRLGRKRGLNIQNTFATPLLQTSKPDRIEESRKSDSSNAKLPLHLNFEHLCNTENDTCIGSATTCTDNLDRIECTRETAIEPSQTQQTKRVGESKYDANRRQSNAGPKSSNGHSNSIRINAHGIDPKFATNSSHHKYYNAPSVASISTFNSKGSRSLHYHDFQSLRLKYQKYIQNLVAQTDVAEQSEIDTISKEPMVVVRSRRLLDHEIDTGNYSVLDIPLGSSRTLAMYETNRVPNNQKLDVKAHVFQFDVVFSERDSFDDFYPQAVQPCVEMARKGGLGTILLCGSDEFGKATTTSGIETRLAAELFRDWDSKSSRGPLVVSYLGLEATNSDDCVDLLSPMQHCVEIIQSKDGNYTLQGATEISVSSSSELMDVWSTAEQHIAMQRMLRGETRHSSYTLCRIMIPTEARNEFPGILHLVRCPKGDQIRPTKLEENNCIGAINPLANLMETIRATDEEHDPVCISSTCNLTKLLGQRILAARKVGVKTRTCLVACVSPCSDDTEATLSTMLSSRQYMTSRKSKSLEVKAKKASAALKASLDKSKDDGTASQATSNTGTESLLLPRQWSPTQLCNWMQRKHFVSKHHDDHWFEDNQLSGKIVMTMNKEELQDCFARSHWSGSSNSKKLFDALRAENDRIARLKVKQKFARQKATPRNHQKY